MKRRRECMFRHIDLCLECNPSRAGDGWRVESDVLRTNNVTNEGIGRVEPVAGHLHSAANKQVHVDLAVLRASDIERLQIE